MVERLLEPHRPGFKGHSCPVLCAHRASVLPFSKAQCPGDDSRGWAL